MHADLQTDAVDIVDHADDQWVELAVEIFKMLADATRVWIVVALRDGELSVNTLADVVGKSPAAVSQHLAKLRLARMVTTRHEGTRVFYRLANEHAQQLVSGAVRQAEHSIEDQPRHHQQTDRGVVSMASQHRRKYAADHDHERREHDHVHNQGPDDSHKHPTGIRGLFYALFVPHSHDAYDSIDDAVEASVAGISCGQDQPARVDHDSYLAGSRGDQAVARWRCWPTPFTISRTP